MDGEGEDHCGGDEGTEVCSRRKGRKRGSSQNMAHFLREVVPQPDNRLKQLGRIAWLK